MVLKLVYRRNHGLASHFRRPVSARGDQDNPEVTRSCGETCVIIVHSGLSFPITRKQTTRWGTRTREARVHYTAVVNRVSRWTGPILTRADPRGHFLRVCFDSKFPVKLVTGTGSLSDLANSRSAAPLARGFSVQFRDEIFLGLWIWQKKRFRSFPENLFCILRICYKNYDIF